MQSNWYLIGAVFGAELRTLAEGLGVTLLENPALPVDPNSFRGQCLFYVHRGDKSVDQPGQRREKRVMRLVLGAIGNDQAATLATVDALHFAARAALRTEALRAALRAEVEVGRITEVEVEPQLLEAQVQGTVLLSAFEIEYLQSYPNAA